MTKDKANEIYNVLVDKGKAVESDRESFVYHHTSSKPPSEWRFQGVFGFGGKYWSRKNRISYYQENENEELDKLKNEINNELSEIKI